VRCEKILIQNLARLSTKKDEHMVYNIRSYFALNLILDENGFVNLFNGLDQEGWNMAGPGRFRVIDQKKVGGYTKKMYGDLFSKLIEGLNAKMLIQAYLLGFLIQTMTLVLLLIQDMRYK